MSSEDTSNEDPDWKFDQERKVGAVTTKQVMDEGLPILEVVHYGDDCSWAFLCGTTEDEDDAQMVPMETIVAIDPTLETIATLEPGQAAFRDFIGDEWDIFEVDEDEE